MLSINTNSLIKNDINWKLMERESAMSVLSWYVRDVVALTVDPTHI